MKNTIIIKNFRQGYGNEETLHIDDLKLQAHTIIGLLGPSASGKSTFMNAILRQSLAPSYWEKGKIYIENKILDKTAANYFISYVPQKARLYTDTILTNFLDGIPLMKRADTEKKKKFAKKSFKSLGLWHIFENILDDMAIKHSMGIHKILLIAKAVVKKPKLLLLDEVLASTSVKDEVMIIDFIKKLKKITTVLLITHNKEEAKELCDSIALVSGGILHEHTPTQQFFTQPHTDIGIEFLESGSAWYSNPNTKIKHKEDNLTALRRFSSVCEFYWVKADKLGGMQKPGLMTAIIDDLTIMKQLHVNVLVSLQQKPIDPSLLRKYNITGLHFPIEDMGIPDLEKTYRFILKIQPLFDQGKSVIYHCKAGMGRTGTLLACNLLWLKNISAIQAIEEIRHVNYKYIQTEQQIEFVSKFEHYLEKQYSD